jgi:hypothetical protein
MTGPLSEAADGRIGLQRLYITTNILNRLWRTAHGGLLPAWGLDAELTTPHPKRAACYKTLQRNSDLSGGNELSGSKKGGKFLEC